MELVGNESRIRALFLELKGTEELATPAFTSVWQQTQTKREALPATRLRAPLAFATASLVVVGFAFTFFIWSNILSPEQHLVINPVPVWASATRLPFVSGSGSVTDVAVSVRHNHFRPTRNRRLLAARQPLAKDPPPQLSKAAVWQSPTTRLLQSPADDLLLLTPQLTQAVVELKSFLPSTEMKETK